MKKVLKIIFWIFLITIMVCSLWSLSFAWFDSENQLNDDTTENQLNDDTTENHHSNNSATDIVNL